MIGKGANINFEDKFGQKTLDLILLLNNSQITNLILNTVQQKEEKKIISDFNQKFLDTEELDFETVGPIYNMGKNKLIQFKVLYQFLNRGGIEYQENIPDKNESTIENIKSKELNEGFFTRLFNRFRNVGGGRSSCGYHVVKNYIYIIRAIFAEEDDIEDELDKLIVIDDANKLFGFESSQELTRNINKKGIWRNLIIDRRKKLIEIWYEKHKDKTDSAIDPNFGELDGENLEGGEISFLIKNEQDQLLKNYPKVRFTIIEGDLSVLADITNGLILESVSCKDWIHAFFINPGGHWILLIINKVDGKIQFLFTDSINTVWSKHKIVNKLIYDFSI